MRDNGCVDLDLGNEGLRWIVWPDTTRTQADGLEIMVDEHAVADADALTGTGALATASVLTGWDDTDTYFGGFGRFCSAGDIGIVVFDDVAISASSQS